MAKRKKKETYSLGKILRNLFFFAGICLLAYLYMRYRISPTQSSNPITERMILQRTLDNYQQEVDSIGDSFEVDPDYLLALIVLECSGRLRFEPRLENHVFEQLKDTRDGKRSFGSIKKQTIQDANDDALKNLATSWGPFQLMGYQCIELDVTVSDIRGQHAIYWGTYWIYKRYAKQLKAKDFSNAFHIHNSGRKIPEDGRHITHDPTYVKRGLEYMKYFKQKRLGK